LGFANNSYALPHYGHIRISQSKAGTIIQTSSSAKLSKQGMTLGSTMKHQFTFKIYILSNLCSSQIQLSRYPGFHLGAEGGGTLGAVSNLSRV